MLEHFSSGETALLQKRVCSKRLQSGDKEVLPYSCLWDGPHTVRAVIECDPTFWAPCSQKDLRAPVIKVCCSAVPSVSIQGLAPERNLRCQIKQRSFLGSAGVSRWISHCLARQGRDACAAREEILGRGTHWRASSLTGTHSVLQAGKTLSIPLNWDTWPTPTNTVGCARADIPVSRWLENSAHQGYLQYKRRHKRVKNCRCGNATSEQWVSVLGRFTWCARCIRKHRRSTRSKNWMFLIPVPESGSLQIGVVKLSIATPRASPASGPHCLVHARV